MKNEISSITYLVVAILKIFGLKNTWPETTMAQGIRTEITITIKYTARNHPAWKYPARECPTRKYFINSDSKFVLLQIRFVILNLECAPGGAFFLTFLRVWNLILRSPIRTESINLSDREWKPDFITKNSNLQVHKADFHICNNKIAFFRERLYVQMIIKKNAS